MKQLVIAGLIWLMILSGCGKCDENKPETTTALPAPSEARQADPPQQTATAKQPQPPAPPAQPSVAQTPISPTNLTPISVASGSSTPIPDEARQQWIPEYRIHGKH